MQIGICKFKLVIASCKYTLFVNTNCKVIVAFITCCCLYRSETSVEWTSKGLKLEGMVGKAIKVAWYDGGTPSTDIAKGKVTLLNDDGTFHITYYDKDEDERLDLVNLDNDMEYTSKLGYEQSYGSRVVNCMN